MFNKINLDLPEKSYQIIVGSNILEQLTIFLQTKNYNKIIAISDENVIKFHGEKLKNFDKNIDFVVVKSGEASKSFAVFEKDCEEILQKNQADIIAVFIIRKLMVNVSNVASL